ncbi:MAG TPA: TetR/AcrR family transcriptional regulator [Bacteroidetes bacterium]|nr:TetR/AcrR family transcriptional regulator [Bacteroidota bacterium]
MNIPDEIAPAKARILKLSIDAFNAKGYRKVSMDWVAQKLQISKKTIYKYFQAKEEILESGLDLLFAHTEDQLKRRLQEASNEEAMQAFFLVYRDYAGALQPGLRMEIESEIPYLFERINTFERQVLKRSFVDLLKDLRSQGGIDYPSPSRVFAASFYVMLKGLMEAPEDKALFIIAALYKGMGGQLE